MTNYSLIAVMLQINTFYIDGHLRINQIISRIEKNQGGFGESVTDSIRENDENEKYEIFS